VIDNSPWPEALNNTIVYSPLSVSQIRDTKKQDLDIMFSIAMKYAETSIHYRLVQTLTVWMVFLGIGLLCSIISYWRAKKKLAKMS